MATLKQCLAILGQKWRQADPTPNREDILARLALLKARHLADLPSGACRACAGDLKDHLQPVVRCPECADNIRYLGG